MSLVYTKVHLASHESDREMMPPMKTKEKLKSASSG